MSKVSLKKEKIKYCIEYTDDKGLFKYKICKSLTPEVKDCDIYHKKMVELVIDNECYVSSKSYTSSKSYVSPGIFSRLSICVPNRFKLEV